MCQLLLQLPSPLLPLSQCSLQPPLLLLVPGLKGTFYVACNCALQAFELGTQTLQQLFLAVPQLCQLSLLLPN